MSQEVVAIRCYCAFRRGVYDVNVSAVTNFPVPNERTTMNTVVQGFLDEWRDVPEVDHLTIEVHRWSHIEVFDYKKLNGFWTKTQIYDPVI